MKRLSLIIIMLGVILLVACATQTQEIPGDAVFQFEIYGGYVPLQMAKQLPIPSAINFFREDSGEVAR